MIYKERSPHASLWDGGTCEHHTRRRTDRGLGRRGAYVRTVDGAPWSRPVVDADRGGAGAVVGAHRDNGYSAVPRSPGSDQLGLRRNGRRAEPSCVYWSGSTDRLSPSAGWPPFCGSLGGTADYWCWPRLCISKQPKPPPAPRSTLPSGTCQSWRAMFRSQVWSIPRCLPERPVRRYADSPNSRTWIC